MRSRSSRALTGRVVGLLSTIMEEEAGRERRPRLPPPLLRGVVLSFLATLLPNEPCLGSGLLVEVLVVLGPTFEVSVSFGTF